MPRLSLKLGLLVGVFAFVLLNSSTVFAALPAHAQNANDNATAAQEKRDVARTRLQDAKLKACQKRETAITNIMTRLSDRGQKQLDLFSGIATKVEMFYVNKGKTLSNYDALVADVNAKKAAAQSTIDALESSGVSFKCDGTDPKGVAQSFKASLKAEIQALQDYRTAVKNLIVGVKSVQGATSSTNKSSNGGQQ